MLTNSFRICMLIAVCVFLAQPVHPLDYYKFAQQWPKGACMNQNKKCKSQIPATFTIHGMWPSNKVVPEPEDCAKTFDLKQIQTLVPQLSNVWPNIENGKTDSGFWRHEWNKHGSCSPFQQYDYFNHVIRLYNQNNLIAMLAAQNIKPNGISHPAQDVVNAIELHVNAPPLLTCVKGIYIAEIHICFNSTLNHITCPVQPPPTCSKDVFL